MTGPATGELATLLATGRKVEAAYELDRWRDAFGHRLAVEVQLHHACGHEAALADGRFVITGKLEPDLPEITLTYRAQ